MTRNASRRESGRGQRAAGHGQRAAGRGLSPQFDASTGDAVKARKSFSQPLSFWAANLR